MVNIASVLWIIILLFSTILGTITLFKFINLLFRLKLSLCKGHVLYSKLIMTWICLPGFLATRSITDWKIIKEVGIPDHLTCLLRNLYEGQEEKVRARHGTTDWFKIGKGVQGCILLPCLFDLFAEHVMQNAGLDKSQAGINIARRNINNLTYADDTTLMAESKEELKILLMRVKKESKKVGLKLNILRSWIDHG